MNVELLLQRPRARWITGVLTSVSLAITLIVGPACGPKTPPSTPPAPAAAPAPPSVAPPPAVPAGPPPAAAAPPPAGAAQPPGATAAAPAAGGRGRGGTPPPPPEPPPAVMPPPVTPIVSMTAPTPDPRVGLAAGRWDAAQAAWNMRMVSTTPPPMEFLGVTNSDLAFIGKYVIQGNYNGYQVWDVSNSGKPTLTRFYLCPASQSDVSVYKNLLFVSAEAPSARLDCGAGGVPDPVSKDRVRGIRIFDVSDMANPKYITNVQTCRGSHTHTLVTDPKDDKNVYIYVSGSAGVRSADEMPGCLQAPIDDPTSALFRIEVIQVPLAAPQQAHIVSSPRIFDDLVAPPRNPERDAAGARAGGAAAGAAGAGGAAGGGAAGGGAAGGGAAGGGVVSGGAGAAGAAGAAAGAPGGRAAGAGAAGGRGNVAALGRGGPNQCHDITVYPEIGLAGGACGGYGLLLDIKDVAHPKRIDAAADANMSFWHSATFSNDGSKVLFTDEWGGGSAPRCRETDKLVWGADALFTIVNGKLDFHSYYKMPAAQSVTENCVAHNGSLIPIPGREVMVQGWYQGGVSVFDWTDVSNPKEIAFFDRGPVDATRLVLAGSWSAYWYNGHIYSSEIARGLDVYDLLPGGLITQNEIDAANTVHFDYLNVQDQPKFVWPPSFALARAYLDQLARSNGLAAARITAVRTQLASAEKLSGQQRKTALAQLATELTSDASGSGARAKVQTLSAAVRDLANAQH
jgi:uncharacterized membrane protein YgcG